jgi:hypothetical protein
VLAYENKGGHIIRRLQEEIQREAQRSERDVTPIMMSLTTGVTQCVALKRRYFLICGQSLYFSVSTHKQCI